MSLEDGLKWYYRFWWVIVLLLSVGPFALPLLWKSPVFSLLMKWVLTIATVVLTVMTVVLTVDSVKAILSHLRILELL